MVRAMGIARPWAAVVAIVAAVVSIGVAPAQARTADDLATRADRWGIPGLVMRIVGPDGVEAELLRGVDGDDRPIDAGTPFVWGSVSKSVAARIAADLAAAGWLDPQALVGDLLPAARAWIGDAVTVGDLIRHTSGLPHDVATTDLARPGPALRALPSLPVPDRSPRGTFRYSSLNYVLLQSVIETITGQGYAEVVESAVAKPAHARIIADEGAFTNEVPSGHVPFFAGARPTRPVFDGAGLGYGYLAGSLDALSAFAQWLVHDARLPSAETVPTGHAADYGPGLYRERIGEQQVWWHSGAVPGYFTHLALIPATGRVLVLAANRYGELESGRFADLARSLMLDFAGQQGPEPAQGRPATVPVAGAAVVVFAGIACLILVGRTLRVRAVRRRRWTVARIAGAAGCAAVASGAILGPRLAGMPQSVLARWAPDIAVVLVASAIEAVVLGALLVVREFTARR